MLLFDMPGQNVDSIPGYTPDLGVRTRNNLQNGLEQLKQRTDIPYSNRPQITWANLVDDLQELITSGSIVTAVHASPDVIYGIYDIFEDKKVIAIVTPPSEDPNFGLEKPLDTFATLAVRVFELHHETLKDPQRLQAVKAETFHLQPRSTRYVTDGINFHSASACSTTPAETNTFNLVKEISIASEAVWSSPVDLIDDTDTETAGKKYTDFMASLTATEKRRLFSNPDAALSLISVVIGIKPSTIQESLSEFKYDSSFIRKTGLRYINGAWVNDQALQKTLTNSGIYFTHNSYEYIVSHLGSNVDIIVDPSLTLIRGIALGYGRENVQPYVDNLLATQANLSDGATQLFTPGHDYQAHLTLAKHLGDSFTTIQDEHYLNLVEQKTAAFFAAANIPYPIG